MGLRLKIFLLAMGLVGIVGLASFAYVDSSLLRWHAARTENHIAAQARTLREALAARRSLESDHLAQDVRALGRAAELRLSIIRRDGVVVADSEIPSDRLGNLDNHGDRPEVQQAQNGELGISQRTSTTLGEELMYAAVPSEPKGEYIIRVAMLVDLLEDARTRLRYLLLLGGLVGLAAALSLSLLASYLMTGVLVRLEDSARKLASVPPRPVDGSRRLGSFQRVAEQAERTVAQLAQERGRFETVLQSMSEALLVLDGDRKITLVNKASLELLGLEESPVGQILEDAIRVPSLSELAHQGQAGKASIEFPIGAERPRRVLGRARPLRLSAGTVIVMHDVTDMRRLETVRKDFVANVSHELRTPVSIIRANAETLLGGALEDPERARAFVEALHRNSERLSRIIADLLDLSRVEAGRFTFDLTEVDLGSAVQRAVEAVESKAEQRRIMVEVATQPDLRAMADAKALDQALLNLLDNSIKYTPEGGHVSIRADRDGEQLKVEVQDDGPGIKPEHQARIFERFYRIDPGRSRDMGGTGLGLAIVKHFMESMQGGVGVEAAFPRGSIFWISVPAAKGPSSDELTSESPAEAASAEA
ncbi:MAG: ATP-binding protein [Myxococcota bacterium]